MNILQGNNIHVFNNITMIYVVVGKIENYPTSFTAHSSGCVHVYISKLLCLYIRHIELLQL